MDSGILVSIFIVVLFCFGCFHGCAVVSVHFGGFGDFGVSVYFGFRLLGCLCLVFVWCLSLIVCLRF